MKKTLSILALILAVVMIAMCCAACGEDEKKNDAAADSTAAATRSSDTDSKDATEADANESAGDPTVAPTDAPTDAPAVIPTDAPTEAQADTPADTPASSGMTLSDFLETPAGQQMAAAAVSSLEESTGGLCTGECYAEGQCFVLECVYTSQFDSSTYDAMSSALQAVLDSAEMQEAMKTGFADPLESVGVSGAQVKIRYLTSDGKLLAERTF